MQSKGGAPGAETLCISWLIRTPGNVDEESLPLSSHGELADFAERHAES